MYSQVWETWNLVHSRNPSSHQHFQEDYDGLSKRHASSSFLGPPSLSRQTVGATNGANPSPTPVGSTISTSPPMTPLAVGTTSPSSPSSMVPASMSLSTPFIPPNAPLSIIPSNPPLTPLPLIPSMTHSSSPSPPAPSFRARLQKARVEKRLSISALAKEAQCSADTLASFERGDAVLDVETQTRIARALGIK